MQERGGAVILLEEGGEVECEREECEAPGLPGMFLGVLLTRAL